MKAYSITDKGLVRSLNEDFYYLPRRGESFALVADGMGGHNAGEVASRTATFAFARALRGCKPNSDSLRYAFDAANRAVLAEADGDESKRGMGTTLTAVWLAKKHIYLGHIGDSRAYRLRGGELTQMTRDHSYVQELVDNGIITPEQAAKHPKRNIITRCIGVFEKAEPDIIKLEVEEGDVWLLCSDGLCGCVSHEAIEQTMVGEGEWPDKLKALKDLALASGGQDNVTIVLAVGGRVNEQ